MSIFVSENQIAHSVPKPRGQGGVLQHLINTVPFFMEVQQ
jgi:hypothetical protein